MNLLKRDTKFFDLLNKQADFMVTAAQYFNTLLEAYAGNDHYITAIAQVEHDADLVRHEFSGLIDSAFITPMDKEDLTALADKLDDVIDCIESASGRFEIYCVQSIREDIKPMAENLLQMSLSLQSAVKSLGESKDRNAMKETFITIHSLENATDKMFRGALGELFLTMREHPVDIIVWKEIYDRIERAVDKCEDAANVIESMVVKYA